MNIKSFLKRLIILIYRLFRHLPIKNNWILFESSNGRNYTGNPKYIYETMVDEGLDHKFKCIWILEDLNIEIPGNNKKIKRSRFKYYYYIARAKFWIFDTRDPRVVKKRKETTYIQTWHGTPLKKLGLDMDDVFMCGSRNIIEYKCNMYKDSRKWDFLLSQNRFSTKIFESAFAFSKKISPDKEILEFGYPRNDILINKDNDHHINSLKDKLNLPKDKKIILYAPTWRDDEYHRKSVYKFISGMDFQEMFNELSDEYIMIVKYHYLVSDDVDWSKYKGFIFPSLADADIAELYLISDILITDYSSVFFDYSILNRPMLFFMYDLDFYRDKLRGFYIDIESELPGPISKTTEDLIRNIKNYNFEDYKDKYKDFRLKYNNLDDGNSSKRVIDLILSLKDKD